MKTRVILLALPLVAASAAFAKPAPKAHAARKAGTHATAKTAPRARITATQAEKTALRKYPGKVEGKVALENEDGHWQYAVNVRSGKTLREVMVDANTGRIASVEVTDVKEEAREAAAEKKAEARKAAGKKTAPHTEERSEGAGETR